jgi:hypothetical protein
VDAAKVQEEDRREAAAVVIQQACRALLSHRAQLRALARLRAAAKCHGLFERRFKWAWAGGVGCVLQMHRRCDLPIWLSVTCLHAGQTGCSTLGVLGPRPRTVCTYSPCTPVPAPVPARCRRLFLDKLAAIRARIAERRAREAAAVMEAERRAAASASASEVPGSCDPRPAGGRESGGVRHRQRHVIPLAGRSNTKRLG